jgi:hypothetical protein
MAAAMVLRSDVQRPVQRPFTNQFGMLRFLWPRDLKELCCPLGLHPYAQVGLPVSSKAFLGHRFTDEEVVGFLSWWDSLPDGYGDDAVNAIWP